MIGTNEMDIDTAHSYVQQGETDSECLKKDILLYEAWIMTDRIATVQITTARMATVWSYLKTSNYLKLNFEKLKKLQLLELLRQKNCNF